MMEYVVMVFDTVVLTRWLVDATGIDINPKIKSLNYHESQD
jgi:hypothetical protein